jgi:hypothetical protein
VAAETLILPPLSGGELDAAAAAAAGGLAVMESNAAARAAAVSRVAWLASDLAVARALLMA